MVNIIKVSSIILMIAVIAVLSGCEKQPETKQPAKAPVIVSGKIIPPLPVKPGGKQIPKPEIIGPAKMNQAQTIAKPGVKPGVKKADTRKMVQVPSIAATEKLLKSEQAIATVLSGKPDITQAVARYDSTGKLNPFLPLIQEKEERGGTDLVVDNKPKRVLTPLEKMELSQIKLVAVILMENRQLAMVEETTGKGYEVNIGTYMGKKNGQVSKINQSSIVVKEYVKDYKGKLQARFQEIKLQKKEGGE